MKNHRTCRSEVVAQGTFGSVTVCPDCGVYHLHIGPMSFRMEADVFHGVARMFAGSFVRPDGQDAIVAPRGSDAVRH